MRKSIIAMAALAAAAGCWHLPARTPQLGRDPISLVVDSMTLDEKFDVVIGSRGRVKSSATAAVGAQSTLVPGAAGQTVAVQRLGVPPTVLADGPAGLRIDPRRKGDSTSTYYCTHFPVATALSATWDTTLVGRVGAAMGGEVRHYGVDVLLAPATNIQRNPLCGRNFEYYSEDPLLSGLVCAAMVGGIQSAGVGASLKHFALNNQETNRVRNNVIGTPRTFREIYLKPFEIVVKKARPLTVMTSYNKINGTMASERADLIDGILRGEWGYRGMVMSDWHGGISATAQLLAGNDLLMPGNLLQREQLQRAVASGELPMEALDRNVERVLRYVAATPRFAGYVADNAPDLKASAKVARQAATEGMVLLKNDRSTLPLASGVKRLAAFGCASYDFTAGGTGAGNVNHAYVVDLAQGLAGAGFALDTRLRSAYEAYIPQAKAQLPVYKGKYSKSIPPRRIAEMPISGSDLKRAARDCDAAVVTIGRISGEFADRDINGNFCLTAAERQMLQSVSTAFHKAGKRMVVVLNVCGVVETSSWIGLADAVLLSWLPGQEGGNSVADLLTGRECPSGRLPMTWPVSYSDNPTAANFPVPDSLDDPHILQLLRLKPEQRVDLGRRNFDYTRYDEGVYVGYRYYTTRGVKVAFPFGYGLSYTTFALGKPLVQTDTAGNLAVTVGVRNTGRVAGKEVVQVYVAAPGRDMDKPVRELRAFAKTGRLEPGQSQSLTLHVPYADLASFSEQGSCWQVEPGTYTVMVARNAADSAPESVSVTLPGRVTEVAGRRLLPVSGQ